MDGFLPSPDGEVVTFWSDSVKDPKINKLAFIESFHYTHNSVCKCKYLNLFIKVVSDIVFFVDI